MSILLVPMDRQPLIKRLFVGLVIVQFLIGILSLQWVLDRRLDRTAAQIEKLSHLPKGEHLKPMSLGYHGLMADIFWLQMIQVLGKARHQEADFDWIYNVLDVVTTVDEHYIYAFQIGGIVLTEVAHRVDLSNKILEKGRLTNPEAWWLPFNLGYNYYFYLHDPTKAADYMALAARLPGRPAYIPGLATRMYAEAGAPEVALEFLDAMLMQTHDPQMKQEMKTRMREVLIERDLVLLEQAIARFRSRFGKLPGSLMDLVIARELLQLPQEPFGGEYQLNTRTGEVTSSTHPERFRVYRPEDAVRKAPKNVL